MISIRDFAAQQGCGESIIYRHIRKHKEALGDRVQKAHGKTWLTDEGAEYIRALMKQQPVVVSEGSEETELLRGENKRLLEALNAAKERIIDLQEQNTALALKTAKIELLEADNAAARERATQAEESAQAAADELTEAQRRIAELEGRKWYHLLFKKK